MGSGLVRCCWVWVLFPISNINLLNTSTLLSPYTEPCPPAGNVLPFGKRSFWHSTEDGERKQSGVRYSLFRFLIGWSILSCWRHDFNSLVWFWRRLLRLWWRRGSGAVRQMSVWLRAGMAARTCRGDRLALFLCPAEHRNLLAQQWTTDTCAMCFQLIYYSDCRKTHHLRAKFLKKIRSKFSKSFFAFSHPSHTLWPLESPAPSCTTYMNILAVPNSCFHNSLTTAPILSTLLAVVKIKLKNTRSISWSRLEPKSNGLLLVRQLSARWLRGVLNTGSFTGILSSEYQRYHHVWW